MKKTSFGLAAIILLISCGPRDEASPTEKQRKTDPMVVELKALADSVAMNLRDPDSAKFRNVRRLDMSSDPNDLAIPIYCGEVNGKNAYGAYAGFQKFMAFQPKAGKVKHATFWDESQPGSGILYMTLCQDEGKDREDREPVTLG